MTNNRLTLTALIAGTIAFIAINASFVFQSIQEQLLPLGILLLSLALMSVVFRFFQAGYKAPARIILAVVVFLLFASASQVLAEGDDETFVYTLVNLTWTYMVLSIIWLMYDTHLHKPTTAVENKS